MPGERNISVVSQIWSVSLVFPVVNWSPFNFHGFALIVPHTHKLTAQHNSIQFNSIQFNCPRLPHKTRRRRRRHRGSRGFGSAERLKWDLSFFELYSRGFFTGLRIVATPHSSSSAHSKANGGAGANGKKNRSGGGLSHFSSSGGKRGNDLFKDNATKVINLDLQQFTVRSFI